MPMAEMAVGDGIISAVGRGMSASFYSVQGAEDVTRLLSG